MTSDSKLTRAAAVAAARAWIGTPYHHQAALRGAGCDCLGLVRGIYRDLHGYDPEVPQPYSGDWAEATGNEAMLAAARRHLLEKPVAELTDGDVVLFRMRPDAVVKHAAIASGGGRMIHAQEGAAVSEVPLAPWWRRRIAAVFQFPGIG